MRSFVGILFIVLFAACIRSNSVQVSGRVENSDTVIGFYVNDQQYKFRVDEKHNFSGKIELEKSTYAVLMPYYMTVFLTPGEDLEISSTSSRSVHSLQFRGTLSAINNYLKDQNRSNTSFDHNLYQLDEEAFVERMKEMINVNILLLEAKNLGDDFTNLERERIRYWIAAQAIRYPSNHLVDTSNVGYIPGAVFNDFVSSFDINNEAMLAFSSYRRFVLNYIYYQGRDLEMRQLVRYILNNVRSPKVLDYILSEVVYAYFNDNGLKDSDYLLSVCWNVVSDTSKLAKVQVLVDRWRRLSSGVTAPNVRLQHIEGEEVQLWDLRGDYLYICVWTPLYADSWETEQVAWEQLVKDYKGKDIRFMTISLDRYQVAERVKNISGEHFVVSDRYHFTHQYMITSLPRYLLIDPYGRIINVDAPKPSGSAKLLLGSVGL